MKQFFVLGMLLFGVIFNSVGQVKPRAIGIRGGVGSYGNGAELSYQHGLGDENRLELDLGFRRRSNHQHFLVTGVYHWVWSLSDEVNWYAGVGGQLGLYQHEYFSDDDGATLAIGGQLGIEFDFTDLGAPLLLSFDTRPMWGLIGAAGNGYGAALGIRYLF